MGIDRAKSLKVAFTLFCVAACAPACALFNSSFETAEVPPTPISEDADLGTDWFGQASEMVAGDNSGSSALHSLHAEHITPYGAWLSFSNERASEYGFHPEVGWSRQPFSNWSEIEGELFSPVRTHAGPGEKLASPILLFDLEPSTTYYVRVRDSDTGQLSNQLTITTRPDPRPALLGMPTHDPALLAHWQSDPTIQSRLSAARSSLWNGREPAPLAALIYRISGRSSDLARARDLLLGYALPYHENGDITGNFYRWANSDLADAASLLWEELSAAEQNRIAEALLSDDELPINFDYTDGRFSDTDQYQSNMAVQITNGLLQSRAPDPGIRARGEVILRAGLEKFYGMMLVSMRRDVGWNARSGGVEPDGSFYGRESEVYLLRTYWALLNAGAENLEPYWQFVWNSLKSQNLHAATPSGQGTVTFGDIEGYPAQFEEPWSQEIHSSGALLRFGLLWRQNQQDRSAYAKGFAEQYGDNSGFDYWSLVTANSAIDGRDRNDLSTAFATRSKGVVLDRTGWGANDSMLVVWCGPSDVDHKQTDDGDWAWYVDGEWLVHELPEYNYQSEWHSIPLLQGEARSGAQYISVNTAGQASFTSFSADADRLTTTMDLLPVYNSYRQSFREYDEVTRTIVWLKTINAVVVRDVVRGNESAGARRSAIMTHKQVNLSGSNSATFGGARLDTVGASDVTVRAAPSGMSRIEVEYFGDEVITVVQEGSQPVRAINGGVSVGNEVVVF